MDGVEGRKEVETGPDTWAGVRRVSAVCGRDSNQQTSERCDVTTCCLCLIAFDCVKTLVNWVPLLFGNS